MTVTGKFYTDAEILDIRTRAFEEAAKYYERLEKELALEVAARRYAEERLRMVLGDG